MMAPKAIAQFSLGPSTWSDLPTGESVRHIRVWLEDPGIVLGLDPFLGMPATDGEDEVIENYGLRRYLREALLGDPDLVWGLFLRHGRRSRLGERLGESDYSVDSDLWRDLCRRGNCLLSQRLVRRLFAQARQLMRLIGDQHRWSQQLPAQPVARDYGFDAAANRWTDRHGQRRYFAVEKEYQLAQTWAARRAELPAGVTYDPQLGARCFRIMAQLAGLTQGQRVVVRLEPMAQAVMQGMLENVYSLEALLTWWHTAQRELEGCLYQEARLPVEPSYGIISGWLAAMYGQHLNIKLAGFMEPAGDWFASEASLPALQPEA